MEGDSGIDCIVNMLSISIHTLRMEGDIIEGYLDALVEDISIHTLRMEGDSNVGLYSEPILQISIHTLRMEGDLPTKVLWMT